MKLFSLLLIATLSQAQSTTQSSPVTTYSQDTIQKLQRAILENSLSNGASVDIKKENEKKAEAFARQQFLERANKFVALWTEFAHKANDKQIFDVKLAKQLTKAFHDLEKSDGWPIRVE